MCKERKRDEKQLNVRKKNLSLSTIFNYIIEVKILVKINKQEQK